MRNEREAHEGLSESSIRYLHKPERIERRKEPIPLWVKTGLAVIIVWVGWVLYICYRAVT